MEEIIRQEMELYLEYANRKMVKLNDLAQQYDVYWTNKMFHVRLIEWDGMDILVKTFNGETIRMNTTEFLKSKFIVI